MQELHEIMKTKMFVEVEKEKSNTKRVRRLNSSAVLLAVFQGLSCRYSRS